MEAPIEGRFTPKIVSLHRITQPFGKDSHYTYVQRKGKYFQYRGNNISAGSGFPCIGH